MQVEKNQGLRKLRASCKNEKTFEDYLQQLDSFLEYTKSDYDEILTFDIDTLQDRLEDWVMNMGEKGLKGTTAKKKLAGVQKYLDVNRRLYHKKALSGLIKENGNDSDEVAGNVPYTTEDIKKMLEFTTELRTKALIHFFTSTAVRPQGLTDPILRMKHLFDMPYNCQAVRIYDNHPTGVSENSKHGYWVFLTPEASNALKLYHQSRKLNGEKFDEETPIFASMKKAGTKNEHMTIDGIYNIMYGLARKNIIERNKIDQRFDKAIIYGFRKRFDTILKIDNSVNSNIAEKLMAHKKGLDGVYLKPTREQCFVEFRKAIRELTIDNSERDKIIITTLKTEKDRALEESENLSHQFSHRIRQQNRRIADLEEKLNKILNEK